MNWKELGLSFIQRYAVDSLFKLLGGQLKQIPITKLNNWLVNLGKAFGPPGLRHFSTLSLTETAMLLNRAPILRETHTDWIKPLQWVPRTITAWVGPAPTLDDVIAGNPSEMKPFPKNGEWYVIRGYMASTTEEGIHNRLGWRYDDVDDYWTLSVAFKIV